jgi:RNA recognition motif-containing protein
MASSVQGQTKTQLFISGLHEDVDEEIINRHFEGIDKTIKVNSVNVVRDYQTFKPKGFGFIELNSHEDGTFNIIHLF